MKTWTCICDFAVAFKGCACPVCDCSMNDKGIITPMHEPVLPGRYPIPEYLKPLVEKERIVRQPKMKAPDMDLLPSLMEWAEEYDSGQSIFLDEPR